MLKFLIILFVLVQDVHLIISVSNDVAEILLWHLTNHALESRQLDGNQKFPPGNYFKYPPLKRNPTFIESMKLIAKNDKLQCVPRLLCEFTSDIFSENHLFDFNKNSIISILSGIDSFDGTTPIAVFARAALLGYTSKGDSRICWDNYPQCPNDPNQLMFYLNNYNGGFFKLFNGINQQDNSNIYPQSRIQNTGNGRGGSGSIKFPKNNEPYNNYKLIIFPNEEMFENNNLGFLKKPRQFIFENDHRISSYQNWIFFPARTGTGDLRLDNSEDLKNVQQTTNIFSFPSL